MIAKLALSQDLFQVEKYQLAVLIRHSAAKSLFDECGAELNVESVHWIRISAYKFEVH